MVISLRCEARHHKGRRCSGSEFPGNIPDCTGVDVEGQSLNIKDAHYPSSTKDVI